MQRERPDLIFLDIKMPDISGIDWLRSIPDPPLVIFTTAYSEHAVDGFELDAIDYLLKPFSLARFLKAVNKAQELLDLKSRDAVAPTVDHVFIKTGTEQVRILLDDILYVQSAGNYVQFILKTGKLLARITLNEAGEILPASSFTRIHRSYIVANKKVTRLDRNTVNLSAINLPVGRGYIDQAAKIAKD
jgi:two-component system, LytTR family, response regulator